MNIGIVGQGFVGNAVYQKFKKYFDIKTYDIDNSKCNSTFDNVILKSEVIFMCLPTPMNDDGSCNISIVEKSLEYINKKNKKLIIILKSTVPPGTTDKFNDLDSSYISFENETFVAKKQFVKYFINSA